MKHAGRILFLAGAMIATPAQAAWVEARTPHFVVLSDDSPKAVADTARRLERFDMAMRQLHGLPDNDAARANPITVYVLPHAGSVQAICRQSSPAAACNGIAGLYRGRAMGSIAFMPRRIGGGSKFDIDSQTVLFHEYSHHIMLAHYSGAYPAWFVEGFAEFNATASLDDGTVGFGRPAMHRAYSLLAGTPMPIARLLTAAPAQLNRMEKGQLYAWGWLLCHYLTFDKQRDGQLGTYLHRLSTGIANLEAAKAAFGDLAVLQADLGRYIRQKNLSYMALPVGEVAEKTLSVRPLGAGEAAMMPVRLRSAGGIQAGEAEAVAILARTLAVPYPADGDAQTVLAEAELAAGHHEAAEAAADRALAADPANRRAMLAKGSAALHRAVTAKAPADAFVQARRWFVMANHAAPDEAAPLLLFYSSFLAQNVTPSPKALDGLIRAYELAPQDDGLRTLLAHHLIRDRRLAEARIVLAPLAYHPHARPDNQAARLIARIDQGGDMAASPPAVLAMPDGPDGSP